jgi:hypothetical protein
MAKKPTIEEFLKDEKFAEDREFLKGFVKHTLGELVSEEQERKKKEKKPGLFDFLNPAQDDD